MNILAKLKDTLASVLPVMLIVLVLGLTVAPLGAGLIVRFIAGGVLLIFGLTLFLLGVDIGIIPIGERSGAALTARRSLPLLLSVAFVIGVMVTIAEPDVQVLASQIKDVSPQLNKWALVMMIAMGIGLFVVVGLLRTVFSWPLKYVLIVSYTAVFVLAYFCQETFQGVAFDAGGATTGPMTVPFIMALGVGVAGVGVSARKRGDESFGLTGIASIGPIAAVILYGVFSSISGGGGTASGADSAVSEVAKVEASGLGLGVFLELIPHVFKDVTLALLPLVVMFIVFQIFLLKMPPMQVRLMVKGLLYSYVGLVIFLLGVNGGFMPAGRKLGEMLGMASHASGGWWTVLLVGVGMAFGAVVVCAEPAVWVLTEQVENVSGGTISRKLLLATLSVGVAVSVGLSLLRVVYGFNLWYVLIPGYVISLAMTFVCPPLFTAIAFDSGGVASGPMTSTFILSFTLGAAVSCGGNPATDAFGVIAFVAMTPLVAIQFLGIIYRIKNRHDKKEEK